MKKMKHLLAVNEPFSVIQYHLSFKGIKANTIKRYELIHVNAQKNLSFKVMSRTDVLYFKSQLERFNTVLDVKSGRVFDFNNFKKHKESNVILPQKVKGDYPEAKLDQIYL